MIQERDAKIKEAKQKQTELVIHANKLTQKLGEASCVEKDNDEAITVLKREIQNNERIISDLETKLIKQTELEQSNEYLKMEKDKLSQLSSIKDTLIVEYQNTIMLVFFC